MRLSGTKTGAINQYRGLGNQLWDLAGNRPSLDLPFADNKSLVDVTTGANLVDFTRASSGTYVDSEGVIRTATTNLLRRSEEFDDASWSKVRCSITQNSIESPVGTATADSMVATDTDPYINQVVTGASGTYTLSVYLRAKPGNSSNEVRLRIRDAVSGLQSSSFFTITTSWNRYQFTATVTGGLEAVRIDAPDNAIIGDTVYIWGAQVEQSITVGEYIPTTSTINSAPRFDHDPATGESLGLLVEESRTNLLLQSNQFDTIWTNANSSETSASGIAPDGSNTAWLLQDTLDGDAVTHSVRQTISFDSGTTYTLSLYAKANSTEGVHLLLPSTAFGVNMRADYDLINGTTAIVTGDPTTEIQNAGGGWYRCIITATATASASIGMQIRTLKRESGSLTSFYQGDGTGTILIWGAQLEAGSTATSYIPTTDAEATRAADVASISGSNFGTTRTNLLLRSEEFDNASWTDSASLVTANTAVAPNGTLTADTLTPGVLFLHQFFSNSIATYTGSIFVKSAGATSCTLSLVGGLAGLSGGVTFSFTSNTESSFGTVDSVSSQPLGNGWYRVTATLTATGSATPQFRLATSGGDVYIWGAQLETGSTATAYIPTTTAAVTVFESPWYRQDEGTVFAECAVAKPASGGNQVCFRSSDSSYNNSVNLNVQSSGFASLSTAAGGVFDGVASSPTPLSANTTAKFAGAYAANNLGLSLNGAPAATDATATIPTAQTRADIGSNHAGVNRVKAGTIRRLTYWPARLPNETLQTITQ